MTRLLVANAMAARLTVLPHAQQRSPNRGPTWVDFGALRDYINDYDKRRVGQRIIVADVPLPAGSEKDEQAGLFILQAGGDEDRVSRFTSPSNMASLMTVKLSYRTGSCRVACCASSPAAASQVGSSFASG